MLWSFPQAQVQLVQQRQVRHRRTQLRSSRRRLLLRWCGVSGWRVGWVVIVSSSLLWRVPY